MASKVFMMMMMMMIAAAATPALASVYNHNVGDSDGWNSNVNYTKWVEGKEFYYGDALLFKSNASEKHSVHQVTEHDFQNCNASHPIRPPFIMANYTIFVLSEPGKKWYICGVAANCNAGMKLNIIVNAKVRAPAPAPAPAPALKPTKSAATPLKSFAATAALSIILDLLIS